MGKSNRGPDPSALTIHILCARAAGRCQFKGCNKYLFKDGITLETLNNSNIAHIVASSPDGPRGDAIRSHELSNKIDNLMLMCLDHHKLVDSNPQQFTEKDLLEMKAQQEQDVYDACEMMYKEETEIVRFFSPIKGKIEVNIPFDDAAKAVKNEKKLLSLSGITITLKSAADYRSEQYWKEAVMQLESEVNYSVRSMLQIHPGMHMSIFPLAPIPLIMRLGYLLGDKIQLDIYQKTRTPDTWKWLANEGTNHFQIEHKIKTEQVRKIAIVLSLTADISEDRIDKVFNSDVIYWIKAQRLGVDSVKSIEDLSSFWHAYQEVCDQIRNTYGKGCEVAVFPAIPVSAAFEVGRRYMPGVYPKLKIFDECEGFFETLTIGE